MKNKMKQVLVLKGIARIMLSGSLLFAIIFGTSITDGRIIIDFEAVTRIVRAPAAIGLLLIVLTSMMDVIDVIKN